MVRRSAVLVAVLVFALVTLGLGPAILRAPASSAQEASPAASPVAPPAGATPVAAVPPVTLPTAADLGIALPAGIEVVPLTAAPVDNLGISTLLRLERVTVPPGGDIEPRTPAGPELLFGELGSATIVDAFGLAAPLGPGQQAAIVAGSAYALRNTGTAPSPRPRWSSPAPPGSPGPTPARLPPPDRSASPWSRAR